jgi:hypothetical protein
MDPVQALIAGAALVAVVEFLRRLVWPGVHAFFSGLAGAIDNVNGRPAKKDKAGFEVKPALPSLGVQLSQLTSGLAEVRDTVKDQAEQNRRITTVEESIVDLERRVTDVEHLHQVERITSNVAQGKVVDAIAEANRRRGVMDVEPEPGDEPDTEL